MEPKFTQFKAMEAALEKTPHVKAEAHFLLNDVAKKILDGEALAESDLSFLEIVYVQLQDIERNLIVKLDEDRSRAILSKEEFLVAANYFLIAKQNGPESESLRDLFEQRNLGEQYAQQLIQSVSIPEHTKGLLLRVYVKMLAE